MVIPVNWLHGSREQGRVAGVEARAGRVGADNGTPLRYGEIEAAEPGGTYSVGVYDDSGYLAAHYIKCVAKPRQALLAGDGVWLMFFPGADRPVIMGSGAGTAPVYNLGMLLE
jgi:hypothetical protein